MSPPRDRENPFYLPIGATGLAEPGCLRQGALVAMLGLAAAACARLANLGGDSQASLWSLAGDAMFWIMRIPASALGQPSPGEQVGWLWPLAALLVFGLTAAFPLADAAGRMAHHLSLSDAFPVSDHKGRGMAYRLAIPLVLAVPLLIAAWLWLRDPGDTLALRLVRALVLSLFFQVAAMILGGAMACCYVEGRDPLEALRRMVRLLQSQKGHFGRTAVYTLPRWLGVSALSFGCTWATLLMPFLVAAWALPPWLAFTGPLDSVFLRAARFVLLLVVALVFLLFWGILFKAGQTLLRVIAVAGAIATAWCFLVLPFLPEDTRAGSATWFVEAWRYLWNGDSPVSAATAAALGITGVVVVVNSLVIAGMWFFLYPLAAGVCIFFSLRCAAERVAYRSSGQIQQGATSSLFSAPGTFLFARGGTSALETLKPPRGWLPLVWIGVTPRLLALALLSLLLAGGVAALAWSSGGDSLHGPGILIAAVIAALVGGCPLLCRFIGIRLRAGGRAADQRLLKDKLLPLFALGTLAVVLLNAILLLIGVALGGALGLIPGAGPIVWAFLYPLILPGANRLVISLVSWLPGVLLLPAVVATDIGPAARFSDVQQQTEYYARTSPWVFLGSLIAGLPLATLPSLAAAALGGGCLLWQRAHPATSGLTVFVAGLAFAAASILAVVGLAAAITNAYMVVRRVAADRPFRVGDLVILGRHNQVRGNDNWASEMDRYVGRQARIKAFVGRDLSGCEVIHVDIDRGQFGWRVDNLSRTVLST